MFYRDGSMGFGWASLRCARAVAVLLCLCSGLVGRAHALPVYECTAGVTGYAACAGAVLRDDASGPFTGTVWACDGQGFDFTGYPAGMCPGEGWVPVGLLGPGWFVSMGNPSAAGSGVFLPWSFFVGLGGSGAPGGGGAGSDGWTFDDLNSADAARTFSVGFMIVALFWSLGKGAGLIVRFVRRM